jgi:hypothetical protein
VIDCREDEHMFDVDIILFVLIRTSDAWYAFEKYFFIVF